MSEYFKVLPPEVERALEERGAATQLKLDQSYWKPKVEAKDAEIARLQAQLEQAKEVIEAGNKLISAAWTVPVQQIMYRGSGELRAWNETKAQWDASQEGK